MGDIPSARGALLHAQGPMGPRIDAAARHWSHVELAGPSASVIRALPTEHDNVVRHIRQSLWNLALKAAPIGNGAQLGGHVLREGISCLLGAHRSAKQIALPHVTAHL